MKKLFVLLVIVLLIILFYGYLPFCGFKLNRLDDLRNYFTIINTYTTLIIGIFGLTFGAFYYFDKENRRTKLKFLLDELTLYDHLLINLFNLTFKDQIELDVIRNNISRKFEMIEMIIDSSNNSLRFKDEDVRAILKVNSYVEKSELLMRTPFINLTKINLLQAQDNYIELIKKAKWVCMKHSR